VSSDKKVQQIVCRFNTEVLDIQEYIGFIRSKSALHIQEVDDLNAAMKRNGIPELPVREHLGTSHYLTTDEVQDLVSAIQRITPRIDETISELNRRIDSLPPFDNNGVAGEHPGLLGEWISYLMPLLPRNPTADGLTSLREQTISRSDYELDPEEEEVSREDRIGLIGEAINRAQYHQANSRLDTLQYLLDRFGELKIIAKADRHNAVTGPLRQGFIIMMAAFDAAIFDLVRVALERKFFTLARVFGKQDKLSFAEIAEMGSFDALREQIIETQLSKLYVKNLIGMLSDGWKVECFDKSEGHTLGRLIEIIQRRNLHLHSRGVVDEHYVKEGNIDNLKLGDLAAIDDSYWNLAKSYCTYCIRQVAIWAET
jgi:hypothetical protein